MKIWIDEHKPAPDGYHWVQHIDDTIQTLQKTSNAIDRAIRNNMVRSPFNPDGVNIREMQVSEINMPADMANSKACRTLRIYLEETGKTESCPIIERKI